MSNYWGYRDVKVLIAERLMTMDGWKVYGYHPDNSDAMTDYFDPAYWDGIAEKNGYVLCVDVFGASEPKEIREYNYEGVSINMSIQAKIEKLEQMTVERGASEQEEESAKKMIENLRQKAAKESGTEKYTVIGMIPGHMAHPPRMNWHIEKDGVYIAKGNGLLKFHRIDSYYKYPLYMEDLSDYRTLSKEKYKEKFMSKHRDSYKPERLNDAFEYHYNNISEEAKLCKQFDALINKFDTTCGGLLGSGDGYIYEEKTVTEYKKEMKPFETETGSLKEGQCFMLKTRFNYGHNKGQVFRIHETEYNGHKNYHAYKLNGKYTKECTGKANVSNSWNCFDEKFFKWIEEGCISWCEIREVKTPYEVKKVVKTRVSNTKEKETTKNKEEYTYDISEDTDTRDGSKIWLVKIKEKLSKEEYININHWMKELGGYYSKFKHAFLFKENPKEKLNMEAA